MKTKKLFRKLALIGIASIPALSLADVGAASRTPASKSENADTVANVINRNQDNVAADPVALLPEWFKKITISGIVSTDLSATMGKRPFGWTPVSSDKKSVGQSLSLHAAELYIDAQINDWVSAHTTLSYGVDPALGGAFSGRVNSQYSPSTVFVEEASVTLADFSKSPVWATIGRQYLQFGSYTYNFVTKPLTQMLSENNAVAATVGYVLPMGLNADVYVYQGNAYIADETITSNGDYYIEGNQKASNIASAWGANLGYSKQLDTNNKMSVNLGFMNNIANNTYIFNAGPTSIYSRELYETHSSSGYGKAVSGISLHGDISSGPFSLLADYVTALTKFNPIDLPSGSLASISPANLPSLKGAQPWAYGFEAGYNFPVNSLNTTALLGYQQSGDAVNMISNVGSGYYMPQYRYLVGYNVGFNKWLSTKFQYSHDTDYSVSNGGSGKASDSIVAQLKFIF